MTPRDLLQLGSVCLKCDLTVGIEHGLFLIREYIRAVYSRDLCGRRLAACGHGGVLNISTSSIAIEG